MVNLLKQFDKKILIMFCCILVLPIVLILILAFAQGCQRTITYEKYEDKMVSAAKEYFEENNNLPTEESQIKTVKLSKLVKNEYIDTTEELLEDNSCSGTVTVRLNGSQIEENKGGFYNYIPSLVCDDYSSKTLKNEVLKGLTETKDGLYKNEDGSYIFKGKNVDNYVNFYGNIYRIISIDSKGIVKLVSVESDTNNIYWDMKYNTEIKDVKGKNIYEDSNILEKLNKSYFNEKRVSKGAKEKLVSYDVCIGKRAINDIALYSESDCSVVLENQIISLMNITDFALASLESECDSIISKSCKNYNYFHKMNLSTWTLNAVLDNTYEVYYLSSGVIYHQEASNNEFYNTVVYIDSNEFVIEGKGTENNPYKIGQVD